VDKGEEVKAFIDGSHICIVRDDFVNLQESEAVFIEVHLLDSVMESLVKELNTLFAGERK
jgi:hypothetical protein